MIPIFFEKSVTAFERGCSERASTDAADKISSSRDIPSASKIPSTDGLPSVRVPVLSKTIVSAFPAVSRVSADLIRIPSDAAFPVPTITATGVARPNAHGHEMTRTEIATPSANENSAPTKIQMQKTIRAISITAGTKIPATRSARRAIGALEEDASRTSSIICESVVSSPTFSALNFMFP